MSLMHSPRGASRALSWRCSASRALSPMASFSSAICCSRWLAWAAALLLRFWALEGACRQMRVNQHAHRADCMQLDLASCQMQCTPTRA